MREETKATLTRAGEARLTSLPDELAIYTNSVNISATAEEIVIQYGLLNSEDAHEGRSLVRVTMDPVHAKRLLNLLNQVIAAYEEQLGTIPEPREPDISALFPDCGAPEEEAQAEAEWSEFFDTNKERFTAMAAAAREERRQGKTAPLESILDEESR